MTYYVLWPKYAHLASTRQILLRRGETVHAPTYEIKTKKGKVMERLLMHYLVVRGPDQPELVPLWMHSIRSIANAGKFYTSKDGKPHGIPDSDVERQKVWLGRMKFEAEAKAALKQLRKGGKGKVKNGHFAGAQGRITDIRRLRVKINTDFGIIEVSKDDVEAVVEVRADQLEAA